MACQRPNLSSCCALPTLSNSVSLKFSTLHRTSTDAILAHRANLSHDTPKERLSYLRPPRLGVCLSRGRDRDRDRDREHGLECERLRPRWELRCSLSRCIGDLERECLRPLLRLRLLLLLALWLRLGLCRPSRLWLHLRPWLRVWLRLRLRLWLCLRLWLRLRVCLRTAAWADFASGIALTVDAVAFATIWNDSAVRRGAAAWRGKAV